MNVYEIVAIVLGATGFWKLIELLMHYNIQRKLKKAEIRRINAQANDSIVTNWVQWSEKMEKRISQLENKNTAMSRTITKQRDRITELEKYIEQLEAEIQIYNKKKRE